jgi:hypothetical protein
VWIKADFSADLAEAGSVWDHHVAEFLDRHRVGKHALSVRTICIARRCDPARRQETCQQGGVMPQHLRAARPVGGIRTQQFTGQSLPPQ